jgi:O-antigen ligase
VGATLAFVPIYASPNLRSLLLEPSAVLLWCLAAALVLGTTRQRLPLRLSAVDGAAFVFFALLLPPVLAGQRTVSTYVYTMILWLGPYLGARAFVAYAGARSFVRTIAVAALALSPFVISEAATGQNVFSALALNSKLAIWLEPASRLGHVRPAASFGQPLALSMFLAVACTFCVALSLDNRERRRSLLWLAGACLLGAAQALTLSRTGWVVLGVALALLASRRVGLLSSFRFSAAIALALVVLFALPQARPTRQVTRSLFARSPTGSTLAANAAYRERLLHEGLRPGVLTLFGNRERAIEGSVDNEYLYLGDQWGIIALAGLVALAAVVGLAAVRGRGEPTEIAVPAVAAATCIGLFFVALITQQQILFWMLVGATAAISARSGAPERLTPPSGA